MRFAMYAYDDDSMRIRLSAERRAAILALLKSLFLTEFDEELSTYRAERILDFFVKALGPSVYNQAIQDARKFMLERLEDLDSEFYEAEDLR
jgi:uncharacterized protein (DUF2164 family)